MSQAIARRYARALYSIGTEMSKVDAITREFADVAATIAGSPELSVLLSSPIVSVGDRRAVMRTVLERMGVSETVRNASLLLTDRRKGALIPDVAKELAALGDEKSGKVRAEVTSAVPLSEEQYAKLAAVLEKLTGRAITLGRKVDASLIGGVVTRIGDKVYDGSLRTRLEELRATALQA